MLLGFFGPLALLTQLVIWALGLMIGYGLIEWALVGGSFSARFLTSSGLLLTLGASSGSAGVHVVELLEAATGAGVLFIVIGYMPAVYSAFSRREAAMSQLAIRAGSPPIPRCRRAVTAAASRRNRVGCLRPGAAAGQVTRSFAGLGHRSCQSYEARSFSPVPTSLYTNEPQGGEP